jgi:hypothetical protein
VVESHEMKICLANVSLEFKPTKTTTTKIFVEITSINEHNFLTLSKETLDDLHTLMNQHLPNYNAHMLKNITYT